MTREGLAKGLALLGVAFNREITPLLLEVYEKVLSDMSDTQWEKAVTAALNGESYFPPPAVLRKYGLPDATVRAAELYQAILSDYESGAHLGPREVKLKYGEAAMEAFVSAGGVRAFEWCEPASQPFRAKAFIEGWVEITKHEPEIAGPPRLSDPQEGPSPLRGARLRPQVGPGPVHAPSDAPTGRPDVPGASGKARS